MLWVTLPPDAVNDDKFWISLRKLFRYVKKGSGRIVFHMPRRNRSWRHDGVRTVLEDYGLHKVSFELGGERHTVATNDVL